MTDSMERILTNAASGMSAQSIRMNTIASNLANAGSVGGTEASTYRTKTPIFSEVTQKVPGLNPDDQPIGGVRVTEISKSKKPLDKRYEPDNPMANQDGFVYVTDVNPIEQMTNMIDASKEYEANIQVMNTTKDLLIQSLNAIKE
ncbi:MAG: flagellar basal body rod protein FlgC [Gammaproteobacteria bacterium]